LTTAEKSGAVIVCRARSVAVQSESATLASADFGASRAGRTNETPAERAISNLEGLDARQNGEEIGQRHAKPATTDHRAKARNARRRIRL